MQSLLIIAAFLFMFTLTRMVTVFIHEMGHAIAGLILLKGEIAVYVGSYGEPNKGIHLSIGRFKIHFKYNPFLWNSGLCVSKSKNMTLLKGYLFTLAGPMASVITSIACVYLLVFTDAHGLLKLISAALFFSSLQDVFQNLSANPNAILLHDGTLTYNDGQTLKLLRQYRGIYNELMLLHQHYLNNETEKGIALFEEIHARKEHIHLMRIGIHLYMKGQQNARAIKLFQHLSGITTLTSDDYTNYALAHSHNEEPTKALELYNESLRLNPSNFYSLNNRGYTYNLTGRYQEAIADFDEALTLNPKFAYAHNNRGLAKIKLGNAEEGLRDIQKSLELDEKNSYAYKNMGIYYKDLGKVDQALEQFLIAKNYDEKTHGLNELILETQRQLIDNKSTYTH